MALGLCAFATPVRAGDGAAATPAARRVYTLNRCLQLALSHYPKIHEAKARLGHKRAQLSEAYTRPYSEFTATGALGIAPTVHGTAVYSPNSDVSLSRNMALAWQFGIEGLVPLWTFGKITHLTTAAEYQVSVGRHELKKERNSLKLAVRKAYYGAQLARDALHLIEEATDRIDKYLARLEESVKEGEGDDIELLKVKMYRAELDARHSEALKQERVALAGLKFLTGVDSGLSVVDEPLRRARHRLGPLARYLSAARLFRPEINMARAGVLARKAQVKMEQARYFPDLGLGLSFNVRRAPEVADQRNPFAYDPANSIGFGIGLLLRWKLDFLPQAARVAQAEAELEELRATEQFALGGVGVEVEEAFEEARDAARRLDAMSQAANYAKQWLVKVQQGIDIGMMDDEDIVDPAKEYALKRFAKMSATFDYNLAVAKLAQATGWDAVLAER